MKKEEIMKSKFGQYMQEDIRSMDYRIRLTGADKTDNENLILTMAYVSRWQAYKNTLKEFCGLDCEYFVDGAWCGVREKKGEDLFRVKRAFPENNQQTADRSRKFPPGVGPSADETYAMLKTVITCLSHPIGAWSESEQEENPIGIKRLRVKRLLIPKCFPNHHVVELPDGSFAAFLDAPFRMITEKDLIPVKYFEPAGENGKEASLFEYNQYNIVKIVGDKK